MPAVRQKLHLSSRADFRGRLYEREVRIVAIPGTEKLMAWGLRAYPDRFKRQPIPVVEKQEKRFLTLFQNPEVRLPLKRIIVGPAEGSKERVVLARRLHPDVPVIVSKSTPPAETGRVVPSHGQASTA